MSNPTSNFGWQMPTNTDLVTDLPADFEVFGQAVDTSLADLKGGTTGQILSKASGTDMDFTWINNDQGDITGVTAGTGLTGGGTSGSVTLDFDIANYGGGQYAAGKNKIINGDFRINQRAFSSTAATASTYGFDRWATESSGGTATWSAQVFTPGTAPVAGYEGVNYLRCVISGQSGANDYAAVIQKIEDVRTFAGQTVTVSFWAKASTGTPKLSAELRQQFGSGGSADVLATPAQNSTISTSWARYSQTFSVPSISGKTIGTNSSLTLIFFVSAGSNLNSRTNSSGINNATIELWGFQVEAGSTATPFQTATGTIQGELAACQRYYFRTVQGTTGTSFVCTTRAYSTTMCEIFMPLPVPMRVYPTALDYSNLTLNAGATNYTTGTWTLRTYGQTTSPYIEYVHGSAVFTAGSMYNFGIQNGYVGLSAEL